MNDLLFNVLDKVTIGTIVVDEEFTILMWNSEIERISKLSKNDVINKKLSEICPIFAEKIYENILFSAIFHGQSRFCSSVLHKIFIYPIGEEQNTRALRQNMKVEPIFIGSERYALIQIIDITHQFDNELKMKGLIKGLEVAYKNIKVSEETSKQLAYLDSLTGLLNRRSFNIELSNVVANAYFNGEMLAVLFIDLDGFKKINDFLGHSIGDLLLKDVASRLKFKLRSNDIIARLGGDEFTVVLKDVKIENFKKNLAYIAHKLVEEINRPYVLKNEIVNISASIGISIYPDDAKVAEDLIKKADEAMYSIKNSGKNSYSFCD